MFSSVSEETPHLILLLWQQGPVCLGLLSGSSAVKRLGDRHTPSFSLYPRTTLQAGRVHGLSMCNYATTVDLHDCKSDFV